MSSANDDSAPKRVAVVGAGISGLSAALRLLQQDPNVHVTVLEASSRAGGVIRTEHRDGFLIEHGPDAFITNKPGGLRLCEDLGITDELIGTSDEHRRSLVVRNGRPQPIPEGFMLMAPSRPMAVLTTPILSWSGKLRLLSEAFRSRKHTDDDESLASFVRRRFGNETFERLVQPLVGGIYTSDPEKLSLKATLPRFLMMEQQHGSVIRGTLRNSKSDSADAAGSGARYGLFATHGKGLTTLIETLISRLNASGRCDIRFNIPTTGLQQVEGWELQIAGAASERFDRLILGTPSFVTSELIRGIDVSLADQINQIEYASTAIVTSAHRISDFAHPLDAFGLVVPTIERRNVLAVSFSSRKFSGRAPEGQILIRTFIGGATQPELLEQDDEDVMRMALDDMRELLGMSRDPLFASIWRHERAMPQYHVGHLNRVQAIDQRISQFSGLELTGNAWTGVGLPDCISSGYAAADRILSAKSSSPA